METPAARRGEQDLSLPWTVASASTNQMAMFRCKAMQRRSEYMYTAEPFQFASRNNHPLCQVQLSSRTSQFSSISPVADLRSRSKKTKHFNDFKHFIQQQVHKSKLK